MGFDKFKSDNHHSGEHDKRGILWSNFEFSKTNEINYLEFREMILKFIDENQSRRSGSSSHNTSIVG